MAYQTVDVLDVMQKELGVAMKSLRVDGGASANNILLGLQADFLNVPVLRAHCLETTALGAALLAGLAVDCFSSAEELRKLIKTGKSVEPQMSNEERNAAINGWHEAIRRTRGSF